MAENTKKVYLPSQSPNWDDKLTLGQIITSARFFLLRRQMPHGDLVDAIMGYYKSDVNRYEYRSLGHDQHGIVCAADGMITASYIEQLIYEGKAELTVDHVAVLSFIGDTMNCVNTDHYFSTPLTKS